MTRLPADRDEVISSSVSSLASESHRVLVRSDVRFWRILLKKADHGICREIGRNRFAFTPQERAPTRQFDSIGDFSWNQISSESPPLALNSVRRDFFNNIGAKRTLKTADHDD